MIIVLITLAVLAVAAVAALALVRRRTAVAAGSRTRPAPGVRRHVELLNPSIAVTHEAQPAAWPIFDVERDPLVQSAGPVPGETPPASAPASVEATAAALADDAAQPAPDEEEIRWAAAFDPRSGRLDATGRLRLIGDLGVIAAEWCVPLLAGAYAEERRVGHRRAALTALAACNSRSAIATYRAALTSDDADERAIASDALADLEPPPAVPKRNLTVERR